MQRLSSGLVLIGSLALVANVLVLVHLLTNLDTLPNIDARMNAIAHGHVHALLPDAWTRFGMPDPVSLLDPGAAVCVSVWALLSIVVLRRLGWRVGGSLGAAMLVGGAFLYGVGWLWLARGTMAPVACGPVIAWMLMSVLYAALLSVGASMVALRSVRRPEVADDRSWANA